MGNWKFMCEPYPFLHNLHGRGTQCWIGKMRAILDSHFDPHGNSCLSPQTCYCLFYQGAKSIKPFTRIAGPRLQLCDGLLQILYRLGSPSLTDQKNGRPGTCTVHSGRPFEVVCCGSTSPRAPLPDSDSKVEVVLKIGALTNNHLAGAESGWDCSNQY